MPRTYLLKYHKNLKLKSIGFDRNIESNNIEFGCNIKPNNNIENKHYFLHFLHEHGRRWVNILIFLDVLGVGVVCK